MAFQVVVRATSTPAFLLAQKRVRESDLFVTLYTESTGRVHALARGALRSRKRFGAALAPFVRGEAELVAPRTGDVFTLNSFSVQHDYTTLGYDPVSLGHAAYGSELVKEFSVAGVPDTERFALLEELYEQIVAHGPAPLLLRAFELAMLRNTGLQPSWHRCVVSGRPIEPPLLFSLRLGGMVHPVARQQGRAHDALPMGQDAWQLIGWLDEMKSIGDYRLLPNTSEEARKEVRALLQKILALHIRGPLQSLAYLSKLRGLKG